jgi:hypothetical protein
MRMITRLTSEARTQGSIRTKPITTASRNDSPIVVTKRGNPKIRHWLKVCPRLAKLRPLGQANG